MAMTSVAASEFSSHPPDSDWGKMQMKGKSDWRSATKGPRPTRRFLVASLPPSPTPWMKGSHAKDRCYYRNQRPADFTSWARDDKIEIFEKSKVRCLCRMYFPLQLTAQPLRRFPRRRLPRPLPTAGR